jgi:hypothetical protein
VLVHSVFGVWIGVPEPVSDRDTRDRDHECKEEDRNEGVKDVVHSVVLVLLFLFVVYLTKKRKFQILEIMSMLIFIMITLDIVGFQYMT